MVVKFHGSVLFLGNFVHQDTQPVWSWGWLIIVPPMPHLLAWDLLNRSFRYRLLFHVDRIEQPILQAAASVLGALVYVQASLPLSDSRFCRVILKKVSAWMAQSIALQIHLLLHFVCLIIVLCIRLWVMFGFAASDWITSSMQIDLTRSWYWLV